MSEHIIEAVDLDKSYFLVAQEIRVLKQINLGVKRGDFVSIMGRSGSGKSSLLNILGCLDLPTSGEYRVNGVSVSTLNDSQLSQLRNTHIGFVFQTFNLIAQLTVLENVEVPLIYAGMIKPKRRQRCREMLEMVGLGDRMEHRPNQLSGGQMQRVAIARALVNDPAMILADEPTGSLDTATSTEVMAILRDLNNQGRTIMLVTHDEQVAAYADINLHLVDGRLQEQQ